jgi:hypothetical protein
VRTRNILADCAVGLLLLGLLSGCSKAPSSKSVPGTYQGSYAKGVETVNIKPDGTFDQIFFRNGSLVYSNSGSWRIDGWKVVFEPFVEPDGVGDERKTLPEKYDIASGTWHGILPLIIFSDDERYWIAKQEK